MVFRFLIPQSQKATDIISKQIMDFIEHDESWLILYNLLQQDWVQYYIIQIIKILWMYCFNKNK